MDSSSTLGLAGNIVNFIDFAGRLIGDSLELCNSADGASASHKALEDVTKDLENLCDDLASTGSDAFGGGSSESAALQSLMKPCRNLGCELLAILRGLKVQGQGRAWKSVRQAFKSALQANKINTYRQQLDLYKSQFASRLLLLLWDRQKASMESQSKSVRAQGKLGLALDKILKHCHQLGINVREDISKLEVNIHKSLYQATNGFAYPENVNLHAELPPELPHWVSRLHKESFSMQKQIDIISSLDYLNISERERNVKDPHPETYEWLFEGSDDGNTLKSSLNVLDWL